MFLYIFQIPFQTGGTNLHCAKYHECVINITQTNMSLARCAVLRTFVGRMQSIAKYTPHISLMIRRVEWFFNVAFQ